jgi:hypothetical protein
MMAKRLRSKVGSRLRPESKSFGHEPFLMNDLFNAWLEGKGDLSSPDEGSVMAKENT